jgi:catechol 2,3-dioxygenase-like lactoylglutathione lyase family enzyme
MQLRQTVIDATNPRQVAEFYRQLLGWEYRPGDEPPAPGKPDPNGDDWLVLSAPDGGRGLAFQKTERLTRSTWPSPEVPQQLHLDISVPTREEFEAEHQHVLALGGELIFDRSDDPEEPLHVYADPAGHPFCIFVAED